MLKPDIYISSVLEITHEMLKRIGVFAIILDVDNTIRQYKNIEIIDGVSNWIKNMKECGVLFVIASNNFKKNIKPIAKTLDLPYVSLSFKPFPFGLKRAAKKLGVDRKNIVVVGDQFFTDVIGGKLQGFKTILTKPIKKEDGLFWNIRRGLEKIILKKFLK